MSTPDRCFFCAYEQPGGHAAICPVGYPSKHHYKKVWWEGYLKGLGGRDADPKAYISDQRDRDTYMMGWVQGEGVCNAPAEV